MIAWDAHEATLCLSIIALNVAVLADAPESHRIGVATDYIHWFGRLMRSDIAAKMYDAHDIAPTEHLDVLLLAAQPNAKDSQNGRATFRERRWSYEKNQALAIT